MPFSNGVVVARPRQRWLMLAALLGVLSLIAAACGSSDDDSQSEPDPVSIEVGGDEPTYLSVAVLPPIPKPDVVLTDTAGEPYDIHAETEGELTLFYIGYTNCPDICPTHLLDIANAFKELPTEVTDRINVVFMTADPERDTPEVMRRWLDLFDASFIGLTGDRETLEAVQRSVGVEPATTTDIDGDNYAVNHAAFVMAFTDDDVAHTVFPFGIEQEAWLHDLPLLVEGYGE